MLTYGNAETKKEPMRPKDVQRILAGTYNEACHTALGLFGLELRFLPFLCSFFLSHYSF